MKKINRSFWEEWEFLWNYDKSFYYQNINDYISYFVSNETEEICKEDGNPLSGSYRTQHLWYSKRDLKVRESTLNLQRYKQLQVVKLEFFKITQILNMNENITHVELVNCQIDSDISIFSFLKNCEKLILGPKIESFSVLTELNDWYGNNFFGNIESLSNLKKLKVLNVNLQKNLEFKNLNVILNWDKVIELHCLGSRFHKEVILLVECKILPFVSFVYYFKKTGEFPDFVLKSLVKYLKNSEKNKQNLLEKIPEYYEISGKMTDSDISEEEFIERIFNGEFKKKNISLFSSLRESFLQTSINPIVRPKLIFCLFIFLVIILIISFAWKLVSIMFNNFFSLNPKKNEKQTI